MGSTRKERARNDSSRAEIAVVGGGVIGLAVANELLDRGYAVTLVDEAREGVASNAAAGMLAPFAEDDVGADALVPLMNASLEMYPGWVERIASADEVDLTSTGSLFVARDRDRLATLRHEARRRTEANADWLDRDALFELEPHLSPRALGGFRVARERAIDPRRLRAALARRFDALGGRRGDAGAGLVVRCCGAWTDPWVRPVRGQALLLSGAPLVQHVIRTPDVYLVPRRDGRLYVGATSDERGFDATASAGDTLELLREAFLVVPGIAELAIEAIVVGFRPATRDHLPVIGYVAPDTIVATGHYRNGVLLAPITARLVADLIDGDAVPALAPFDPARFKPNGGPA